MACMLTEPPLAEFVLSAPEVALLLEGFELFELFELIALTALVALAVLVVVATLAPITFGAITIFMAA